MRQHRRDGSKRWPKIIGLGAKIIVSLAAISILSTRIEAGLLVETLGKANPGLILAAIFALAFQPLLAAIRWWELLRSMLVRIEFGRLVQIIYVAVFFNQVLPASIGGDVIRVWLVRRDGCSLSKGVVSVLIDRFFMVLTLLILVVLGNIVLNHSFTAIKQSIFVVSAAIIVTAIIILIILVVFRINLVRLLSVRLWELVEIPARQLRMFLVHPRALASVSFFSLASHGNIILSVFLLMLAFGGTVSFIAVAALMPLVLVAATLPISFGGWGVRELAMVTVFAQIGVPEAAALSASVLLGVISIVVTVPGAAMFATLRRTDRHRASMPEDLGHVEASQGP